MLQYQIVCGYDGGKVVTSESGVGVGEPVTWSTSETRLRQMDLRVEITVL